MQDLMRWETKEKNEHEKQMKLRKDGMGNVKCWTNNEKELEDKNETKDATQRILNKYTGRTDGM
jgi:hypothetical protein